MNAEDRTALQQERKAERNGLLARPLGKSARKACERLRDTGLLVSPFTGFYLRAEYDRDLTPRSRILALIRTVAQLHPDWIFCSFSAAVVYGLQVPHALLGRLHLATPPNGNRHRLAGVACCHRLRDGATARIDNVLVTTIEQTLLDCLCQASFRHGLAIADSSLHWNLTDRDRMERFAAKHGTRRHGIKTARAVLRYADGRSDNGGESVARAIMIEEGLMLPELQVEVPDPLQPGAVKVVDFLWRLPCGKTIIGELDGEVKYQGTDRQNPHGLQSDDLAHAVRVLSDERRREARLNLTGATVVRFSYAEALNAPYLVKLLTTAGVPFA